MNYGNLPLFELMKAKLNYTSARAGVLAQNIANADTPGYRARDIKEPNFANMLSQQEWLEMARTSGKHMGSRPAATGLVTINRESTYDLSPTDNNVSIEEEMQRVAMNQGEYNRALNLYRKTVTMFRTALGSPNAG
jgi:flagellar basal-body rod protein FlgB